MLNIYVCVGSACHQKGSYNILYKLLHMIEDRGLMGEVTIKASLCLGRCTGAVSARIGEDGEICSLSEDSVQDFFEAKVLKRLGMNWH